MTVRELIERLTSLGTDVLDQEVLIDGAGIDPRHRVYAEGPCPCPIGYVEPVSDEAASNARGRDVVVLWRDDDAGVRLREWWSKS